MPGRYSCAAAADSTARDQPRDSPAWSRAMTVAPAHRVRATTRRIADGAAPAMLHTTNSKGSPSSLLRCVRPPEKMIMSVFLGLLLHMAAGAVVVIWLGISPADVLQDMTQDGPVTDTDLLLITTAYLVVWLGWPLTLVCRGVSALYYSSRVRAFYAAVRDYLAHGPDTAPPKSPYAPHQELVRQTLADRAQGLRQHAAALHNAAAHGGHATMTADTATYAAQDAEAHAAHLTRALHELFPNTPYPQPAGGGHGTLYRELAH